MLNIRFKLSLFVTALMLIGFRCGTETGTTNNESNNSFNCKMCESLKKEYVEITIKEVTDTTKVSGGLKIDGEVWKIGKLNLEGEISKNIGTQVIDHNQLLKIKPEVNVCMQVQYDFLHSRCMIYCSDDSMSAKEKRINLDATLNDVIKIINKDCLHLNQEIDSDTDKPTPSDNDNTIIEKTQPTQPIEVIVNPVIKPAKQEYITISILVNSDMSDANIDVNGKAMPLSSKSTLQEKIIRIPKTMDNAYTFTLKNKSGKICQKYYELEGDYTNLVCSNSDWCQ